MNSILVVGANSFIGRHLVNKLIKKGEDIIALVRSAQKIPSEWNGTVKIRIGDITEKESLVGVCKDVKIVFHLAAKVHDFSGIGDNVKEHFAVNVEGTRNLLDECKNYRLMHFVYFSSVKAMAEESNGTLDELFPPKPTTAYGKSKIEAEKLVAEYGREYGFTTTSLRLPMVYGPGNKGNIYKMIEAIDKRRFIMIGTGDNRRSMVFVGNVVDAALAIVEDNKADGKVYIVTDGVDYTVRDLYRTIAKELGKKPLPFHVPLGIARILAGVGDIGGSILKKPLLFNSDVLKKLIGSLTFSSAKIQSEIGFKPKYNLYNTINETIMSYREDRSIYMKSRN